MRRGPYRWVLLVGVLGAFVAADGSPRSIGWLLREAESVRSSDPARFESLLRQVERRSSETSDAEREFLRYLNAYRLGYGGHFDDAIREARSLFDETSDASLQLRVGAFVVNSLAITRRFGEALEFLDRTLSVLPRTSDPEARHDAMVVAGITYNQVGQFELGRHYADLVLAGSVVPRTRCVAAHVRMESLHHLDALPQDHGEIQTVIDQCEAIGEPIGTNLVRGHLARQLARNGQAAEAIDMLESSLAEVAATRYPRLISEIDALLAELWLSQQDLAKADAYAIAALEAARDVEFSLPTVMAHRVRYEVARLRDDTHAALDRYVQYAEADKAYLNETQARALAYQLAKHETMRKNQTIELLNRQNDVLRLEQRVVQQKIRNNYMLFALLLSLLASIGYWGFKVKRLQLSFRRQAETDALTGLFNRHGFVDRARGMLARCSSRPVALLMLDLDRFKSINDTFGHAAGDRVLQCTADACRAVARPGDLQGRLGGEEFAVLMSDITADDAMALAERYRLALVSLAPEQIGSPVAVSGSFGVATVDGQSPVDLNMLMTRADRALYAAKSAGRNRVVLYRDEAAADPGVTPPPAALTDAARA